MTAPRPALHVDLLGTFIVELFRLNGVLLSEGDRITRDLGLSSARWQILGAIELAGRSLSVSQIARNMGLSRQSVQRIANELCDDGLLAFENNPDHERAKLVILTTRGRKAFLAAMKRQAEWGNTILVSTGLTDKRVKQATDTMRQLRTFLSE